MSFYRVLGVRGLLNCGLSCCVNALLQSFSATTELLELLMRWQPSGGPEGTINVPLQLMKALRAMKEQQDTAPQRQLLRDSSSDTAPQRQLLRDSSSDTAPQRQLLRDSSSDTAPQRQLLDCLHHYNICRYSMHDADEVFHSILNLIQKQMSDQDLAAQIKNLFKIEIEGRIICGECTYVHGVPSYLLSLPLHIREDQNTIEDCIRSFFEHQQLEDSELVYCDRCDDKKTSSQVFKLVSLPSILCIYLKRFRSSRGYTEKLHCEVSFPEAMDLAEVLHKEHSEMPEGRYRLYAVIVHSGTATVGHYTAFVCSLDGKWYYTDDSCVCEASWEDVQKTYGDTYMRFRTAYMLLYRRQI